jgi:hypothetical protein
MERMWTTTMMVTPDMQGVDGSVQGGEDSEAAGESDDPSDPTPDSVRTVPCTVWFGPKTSEHFEREMAAFLGSHNGVAVLRWARDTYRARSLRELGIPCLWFVKAPSEIPAKSDLEEWLPQNASDKRVHDSLLRLSEEALATRTVAPVFEGDRVRLGEFGVHLSPSTSDLASVLIAHFDHPVDDSVLSETSKRVSTARGSLFSDLFHLDQCVNQLGLEIIPVRGQAHQIQRCGR